MQQSIKTRETQHKQNLCYTITSLKTKKHFNTFVITQLEFAMAVQIWYLKNVRFLLGHPVYTGMHSGGSCRFPSRFCHSLNSSSCIAVCTMYRIEIPVKRCHFVRSVIGSSETFFTRSSAIADKLAFCDSPIRAPAAVK